MRRAKASDRRRCAIRCRPAGRPSGGCAWNQLWNGARADASHSGRDSCLYVPSVIVKPNAGLPKQKDGQVYYDVDPDQFAQTMEKIVHMGSLRHWRLLWDDARAYPRHGRKNERTVRYPSIPQRSDHRIFLREGGLLGEKPVIIGERINPTGKKKFKQALKDHDLDYILKEGITQQDKGAHILDVNVGLPDIDESAMMQEVVTRPERDQPAAPDRYR